MPFIVQGAIAKAGGVKALVDLIFKWSTGGDGVLVCTSTEMITISLLFYLLIYVFMNADKFSSMICFIHSSCQLVISTLCRNERLVLWLTWQLMTNVAWRSHLLVVYMH